jgi:hypothetical protein
MRLVEFWRSALSANYGTQWSSHPLAIGLACWQLPPLRSNYPVEIIQRPTLQSQVFLSRAYYPQFS